MQAPARSAAAVPGNRPGNKNQPAPLNEGQNSGKIKRISSDRLRKSKNRLCGRRRDGKAGTPLKKRKRGKRLFCFLLAWSLLLSLLPWSGPVRAEAEEEARYIVKYRAWAELPEEGLPFEVVTASELRPLLEADLLEYYEEDAEALLLEGGDPARTGYLFAGEAEEAWNLYMVGADTAFRLGYLGQGVRVGVIDSGINPHPAFGDRLLPGSNYVEGEDPEDTRDAVDHGTRVAGLIGGSGDGGYIGAAPAAELVPLKCTNGHTVPISAVCAAIYGGIRDHHCNVLNLSLGTKTFSQTMEEAIVYAVENDVVVVASAGNAGDSALYYPAACDGVMGVGSVDRSGEKNRNSNYNESVFLTAPGDQVRSTAAGGGYGRKSGTSFSAPHAAAAAAVLLSADPSLLPGEIMELLASSSQDRGDPGWDPCYGHGILSIADAVTDLEAIRSLPLGFFPARGPATEIWNNGAEAVDCVYFLAEYGENGQSLQTGLRRLTVPAGGRVPAERPGENGGFGQFLCEAGTLLPLLPARKRTS